ncbi:MAG: glycosyltransferase family protein [Caulobacteraceae bacterium]
MGGELFAFLSRSSRLKQGFPERCKGARQNAAAPTFVITPAYLKRRRHSKTAPQDAADRDTFVMNHSALSDFEATRSGLSERPGPAVESGGGPQNRPRIGVVLTWPEIKNAEYEVVQRLITSGQNIGVDVVVLDNDGYPIWNQFGVVEENAARVGRGDVEFIISLHFESPRLYDVFSYAALWNPVNFFFMFGYDGSVEKLVSHNDVLSCKSDMADAQALSSLASMGRAPQAPLPLLFHSMGEPFLEPRIGADAKLFYIGINWEKISNVKGRHHDLLERLDSEDLISIYGPEIFQGVRPWEGFKTYKGSIPFDGVSVLTEINRAGICLAVSSAAHKSSGIMSNRLFEGLAAGAVIIASSHPLIDKFFSDCVYVVDDRLESEELAAKVRALVLDIRADPAKALDMARRGQQRLRDYFSMDICLKELVDRHPARVAEFEQSVLGNAQSVCVIAYCAELDWAAMKALAENCNRQVNVMIDVILVGDETLIRSYGDLTQGLFVSDNVKSVQIIAAALFDPQRDIAAKPARKKPLGPIVYAALPQIKADFFCFLKPAEYWFSDHLASLAGALVKSPSSFIARSGALIEDGQVGGRRTRRIESLGFGTPESFIYANDSRNIGRSLFRRELLDQVPTQALQLLDGEEHNLFASHAFLKGPIAQTSYATYVYVALAGVPPTKTVTPVEQQHQFIRDTLGANSERRSMIAGLNRPTDFVFASASGAPIRWDDYRQSSDAARVIELNKVYATCLTGDGGQYLSSGFSSLEDEHVWIDGVEAEINFSVPDDEKDLELVFLVDGRSHTETGRAQHCTVTLNDFVLGYFRVANSEHRFALNPQLYRGASTWKVRLLVDHAENVVDDEGKVIDSRRLGLQVRGFGVFDAE